MEVDDRRALDCGASGLQWLLRKQFNSLCGLLWPAHEEIGALVIFNWSRTLLDFHNKLS